VAEATVLALAVALLVPLAVTEVEACVVALCVAVLPAVEVVLEVQPLSAAAAPSASAPAAQV
jgi:hypothetical protein